MIDSKTTEIISYFKNNNIKLSMRCSHQEYYVDENGSNNIWAITIKGPRGSINDTVVSPTENFNPPVFSDILYEYTKAYLSYLISEEEWNNRFGTDSNSNFFIIKNRGARFSTIESINSDIAEYLLKLAKPSSDSYWKLWKPPIT